MNNLGSLLRFEIKKIVAKRSIKVLFAVLLFATLLINCCSLWGLQRSAIWMIPVR